MSNEALVTAEQLKEIMPFARRSKIAVFIGPLNRAMQRYNIITEPRMAMFLAQIAHESGSLNYVRELASGEAYEGREDLGNIREGDGPRYRGRGLIQITGRANYRTCGNALGVDFETWPERLEEPEFAALSAGWFWDSRKLNDLADKGLFKRITQRINGGTNGWEDRLAYYERAKRALGV
jgi:putative chitinase